MTREDRKFFADYIANVSKFHWFTETGSRYTPQLSIPTIQESRDSVIHSIQKDKDWDSFRIAMSNELTDAMVDRGITQAPEWSDRVAIVRDQTERDIQPLIQKAATEQDLPSNLIWPMIQWDLMHAAMESFFSQNRNDRTMQGHRHHLRRRASSGTLARRSLARRSQ